MAKVSHNKNDQTKELKDRSKVTQGEYGPNKYKHKCKVCKCSFEAKTDLTKHNTKKHTLHQCIICKEQKYGEDEINDHTKECRNKRDNKRKEDDRKDAEKKKAHPKFKNMFMHLMDETPDIVEKITEKQIVEETIKKQKREERITKATKKGIPKGAQKMEKLYQKTDKDNRMQMENIRIEKQKKENDIKKQEKEDKNKIKSQAELSKFKVPKLSKNITIKIQIERTKKRRRQAVASFKRIMGEIILAEKITPERKEKFKEFKHRNYQEC